VIAGEMMELEAKLFAFARPLQGRSHFRIFTIGQRIAAHEAREVSIFRATNLSLLLISDLGSNGDLAMRES
jgi:hypothetical protein